MNTDTLDERAPCRAVLFDLDQTLTDRPRSLEVAAEEFARRFGPQYGARPAAEIAELVIRIDGGGYTPRERFCVEVAEALGWHGCAPLIAAFWHDEYPECAVEAEGASALLAELRGRGMRLGIVTNGQTGSQNRKVDHLGFRDRVDRVIVSSDVGVHKPDPAIFRLAVEAMGVSAQETVFVGDHPVNDIVGARAAGMRAVWIKGYFDWPEGTPGPLHTIDQLAALVSLL